GAIVSMVDRASKLTKLIKVSRKSAQEVKEALIERLEPVKEFAKHQEISELLKAEFYFAKPYHSWERGLNEHANGLVRQYFPKSKRFDEITEEKVEKVELLLNNRSRKVLDFATPIEVFSYLREAA
ncbi:MAG: IS30 family transposase, partial [Halioglobus sp.]